MAQFVDLHVHSDKSDGSLTPAQLVRYAKDKGLKGIALTDHDTVDGIDEALREGSRIGVEVMPGVEISTDFKPEMHILGYFSKNTYQDIEAILKYIRIKRNQRNPQIVNRLRELGMDITMDDVKRESNGKVVGRLHIASTLWKKGYVSGINEAFKSLLAEGKPAFMPREKLTPEDGIAHIIKCGGVPVLAHPVFLGLDIGQLEHQILKLKECGLKGIEAIYSENSPEETKRHLSLAKKHGLLITGGSDFHGSFKKGIEIGVGFGNLEIPYKLFLNLKNNMEKGI